MAFKMKGSPFQRNFGVGSPMRKGTWEEAIKKDPNLPEYVKKRNILRDAGDTSSTEYGTVQDKINLAYGDPTRHTTKTTEKVTDPLGTGEKKKVVEKNVATGEKKKAVTKHYATGELKKEKELVKGPEGEYKKKVTKYEKSGEIKKQRKTDISAAKAARIAKRTPKKKKRQDKKNK